MAQPASGWKLVGRRLSAADLQYSTPVLAEPLAASVESAAYKLVVPAAGRRESRAVVAVRVVDTPVLAGLAAGRPASAARAVYKSVPGARVERMPALAQVRAWESPAVNRNSR